MQQFEVSKVIFDLDGTLVDTAPDLLAATNHVLNSIGRPSIELAQVRHMVGYGAMRLIELGLQATGGTDGQNLKHLKTEFIKFYSDNICVGSALFPGVQKTLEELAGRGFQMAICTNKPVQLAHELVNALNIKTFFGGVVGGDSFSYKKPDPRHISETADILSGTGPFAMVGDSKPDIDAAKAANVPSFLMTYGYSAHPLESQEADVILSEMESLPAHLKLVAS